MKMKMNKKWTTTKRVTKVGRAIMENWKPTMKGKKQNTHTPHDHNVVVVAAAAAAHDNIAETAESFDHFLCSRLYISIVLINYCPATCPPFLLLFSRGAGTNKNDPIT